MIDIAYILRLVFVATNENKSIRKKSAASRTQAAA
jgi:hypothetical protein